MTTISSELPKWKDSEWFKKWEELAYKNYQGTRTHGWGCYYDEDNKLTYEYIKMYYERKL